MGAQLSRLHHFIVEHYSTEELKTLCFHLGVRYDNLAGEVVEAKTRELLVEISRQRRFEELIENLNQTRPEAFRQANFPPTLVNILYREAIAATLSKTMEPHSHLLRGDAQNSLLIIFSALLLGASTVWMFTNPGFVAFSALISSIVALIALFRTKQRPKATLHEIQASSNHIRNRVMENLQAVWLRDVLERNLNQMVHLELGLAERPDAVYRPWAIALEQPDQPEHLLPSNTKVLDVFTTLGGAMLILGEPGSGKTITLLELAKDLLSKAELDANEPVPLVFTLASWASNQLPLVDWVAEELSRVYGVNQHYASTWLSITPYHLLLDGLDEVAAEYRVACIEAINKFRQENGSVQMVVCSRTNDYERLAEQLHLHGAVVILPLTFEKIDSYLAAGGTPLAAARTAVSTDALLRELAQSPLILNIIALTYHGRSLTELAVGTLAERRQHLFAAYVQRMFQRRGSAGKYQQEEASRYLAWLAATLKEQSQTMFYIERLQPEWLSQKKRLHHTVTGLLLGLVLGLSMFFMTKQVAGTVLGLILEAFFILLGGFTGYFGRGFGPIRLVEVLDFSLVRGWVGLFTDLRWRSLVNIGAVPVLGLLFGIFGEISGVVGEGQGNAISGGLGSGFIVGLVLFLVSGVEKALEYREVETRIVPNQGIHLSARNIVRGALFYTVLFGGTITAVFTTVVGLVGMPVVGLAPSVIIALIVGLMFGIVSGAIYGLISGMFQYGGLTIVRHYLLRLLLTHYGCLPFRLERFLDEMDGRILLRKIGGGYMFPHRMLLEYFAELKTRR